MFHDGLCHRAQHAEDNIKMSTLSTGEQGLNIDGVLQGNHLPYQGRKPSEARH